MFDITVLGCSGGTLEVGTSAYLVKSSRVPYQEILERELTDEIVAVDCGSGLAKLCEIVYDELCGEGDSMATKSLSFYTKDQVSCLEKFTSRGIKRVGMQLDTQSESTPMQVAWKLNHMVKNYLLTHPHLDHCSGLVINSPSFGAHSGKRVHGLDSTCKALGENVFNNVIWPDLTASDKGSCLQLCSMEDHVPKAINSTYTVTPFKVKHGELTSSESYASTSFVISHRVLKRSILMFGDLEADDPDTPNEGLNWKIWQHVAPMIVAGSLQTVMIECSTPNVDANQPLYGHLTPATLFQELLRLRDMVRSLNGSETLEGLEVLITHIKHENAMIPDPREVILGELTELKTLHNLEVNFTILLPGQTYTVS